MRILIPSELLNNNRKLSYNLYITEIIGNEIKIEMHSLEGNELRTETYSREKILGLNSRVVSFIENYDKRLTKLLLCM